MKLLFIAALSIMLLMGYSMGAEGDKKRLQIGIKKKVENCERTSNKGDHLTMHYTGKLEDRTEFDSSVGRSPFEFTLETGQVIKGWAQGLVDMC